jgi:hypothetical protein
MPRGGSKPGERRGGRQKGTPNRVTAEVRSWARAIFADPAVQDRTLALAKEGKLPPAVFCELMHYAYGKPVDKHEHTGAEGGPLVVTWQR